MFFQVIIPRSNVINLAYELNYELQDLYNQNDLDKELIGHKEMLYSSLLDELTRTAIHCEDCVFNFTEQDIFTKLVLED